MRNVKTNKTIFNIITRTIFSILILTAVTIGIYDYLIPDSIVVFNDESVSAAIDVPFVTATDTDVKLFGAIPLKSVNISTIDRVRLYPGGMPFGVKFHTDGVLVVGINNDMTDNGLRVKDIITHVNDTPVSTVEEVTQYIESSEGNELKFTITRNNESFEILIKPFYSESDATYKTGIWIRDSTAGIGTVTFINPVNATFAGLGHGICDIDTGELMPMLRANIYNVTINGVNKGRAGYPGELKGYFSSDKIGALIGNTNAGVYGALAATPEFPVNEPLPIALKKDIHEGNAYIYCVIDENPTKKYSVEIIKINQNSNDLKNFIVKITDPALLEVTGGIVQGMSGSPVIQDDKLIGAVTHVLINDPTKGYGIFIENMLMNMPETLNQ
jgi:stage IV sporulation protein B